MTERTLRGYESLADFAPEWIATPGDTIADLLEERDWSQADLATRTGFTKKHVHLLLQGKAPVSEDTALKLERVLGSSARFWMNLETQYREQLLRREIRSIEDGTSLKS
jgi:HTH-type transcriptional regulator / antitoxin HigA